MPAPLNGSITVPARAGAVAATQGAGAGTHGSPAAGSLMDADLPLEMAQLADLQNRQSHRMTLSKAKPTPQTLLSLFGDA
jgi:hypothetical protein